MRRILFISLALSAAAAPAAHAQQPVERRFGIDADASVRIHAQAGTLHVTGWERDSVAVTGRIHAPARAFGAGGSGRAGKVNLWTDVGEPAAGDLEIRVPRRATVWIKTATADVEVRGVAGTLDVYSVAGRVFVEGRPQQLTAESMAGPVVLEASSPWLRAKTAGSPITLRGEAEDVELRTVGGEIRVESGGIRRGRFESVTGEIRFAGAVERGASLLFENHSGAVRLALPATTEADVVLGTFKGSIATELGRPAASGGAGLRGKELTFTLGAGGAEIHVQTFSGAIELTPRP